MKPRNRVGERSDFVTSRDARLKNPLTGREPRGRRTAKQGDELAALRVARPAHTAMAMLAPGARRLRIAATVMPAVPPPTMRT